MADLTEEQKSGKVISFDNFHNLLNDKINNRNTNGGNGNMHDDKYVTKDVFNANMQRIDDKFDSLNQHIDDKFAIVNNELKNLNGKNSDNSNKIDKLQDSVNKLPYWIIASIVMPILVPIILHIFHLN